MSYEVSYAFWAKSESEARDMQALGWEVGQAKIVHHNEFALLLVWSGKGEPPLPSPSNVVAINSGKDGK